MAEGVKHYIFLGTGKANQMGVFSFDGPPEDDDGEPVYVSAKDYAALKAKADKLAEACKGIPLMLEERHIDNTARALRIALSEYREGKP